MTRPARQWALVLGVTAGTGGSIAREVARDPGLDIIGFHRGNFPDEAARLIADVAALGHRAALIRGDAGDPARISDCVAEVRNVVPQGSIKLFVHSLSGASLGHFLDDRGDAFHPKQFEKTFNNLAHSFPYWARALHEAQLFAPEARLVGLTNVLHHQMLHNLGLIAAAKAALESYVRYLSVELGRHGHRVNLLQFGTVVTPALRRVMGPGALARLDEIHARMIPAGRMCTVEEVARMVRLLTMDETTWFNGALIDFTGGMTQHLFDLVMPPD
ncbi:MAG: SDR family oxidoreductase [Gammaproteobacteria bacterium]|nr:SDR family oxidoreductase [Gammaproteobacteria bacterium]